MRVEFWYIRAHPITGDLHTCAIDLVWDEVAGDWKLPPERTNLFDMHQESDLFRTQGEAAVALALGEWKRDLAAVDLL